MDTYKIKYEKYKQKYTILKNTYSQNKFGGFGGIEGIYPNQNILVSVGTLNQFALDFELNEKRIREAIDKAIKQESELIVLPELATCGYSCEDHFFEREIFEYSFNIIQRLVSKYKDNDIIISIGCPILYEDVKYNTVVFIYKGEIVLIRPKTILADDGNYREARWFTAWPKYKRGEISYLLNNQVKTCPIGVGIINYGGIKIAAEICEELWVPDNFNRPLYLNGVDIIVNNSGSHFESKKIFRRIDLIQESTKVSGGAYLYSNLEGGDGQRLYFDGGSMIVLNGKLVNIEERFNLDEVKVITSNLDLTTNLRSRMKSNSYETQAANEISFTTIDIKRERKGKLNKDIDGVIINQKQEEIKRKISELYEDPEQEIKEIINAASCWLWDYLRRASALGFVLPLSGGADSAVTSLLVYNMSNLIVKQFKRIEGQIGVLRVSDDIRSSYALNSVEYLNFYYSNLISLISGEQENNATKVLTNNVLNCIYIPTDISLKYKSNVLPELDLKRDPVTHEYSPHIETLTNENIFQDDREYLQFESELRDGEAKLISNPRVYPEKFNRIKDMRTIFLSGALACSIGASWKVINIQGMVEAAVNGVQPITGIDFTEMNSQVTRGRNENKNSPYDLTYQNIQARLRMLNTYLYSQVLPVSKGKSGFYLVLGSSNMDEILVGYYTKYDASAADINPIGSMPKHYINRALNFFSKFVTPVAGYIKNATPTAELIDSANIQTDETDMNLTYEQIYELGKLRAAGFGPQDSFTYIINNWFQYKDIFNFRPKDPILSANSTSDLSIESSVDIDKVKGILESFYFWRYSISRNKAVIIPPSVHLIKSPDDNRFDLRPVMSSRNYFHIKNIDQIYNM